MKMASSGWICRLQKLIQELIAKHQGMYVPVILAVRKLRLEDCCELEATLGYTVRPCHEKRNGSSPDYIYGSKCRGEIEREISDWEQETTDGSGRSKMTL